MIISLHDEATLTVQVVVLNTHDMRLMRGDQSYIAFDI